MLGVSYVSGPDEDEEGRQRETLNDKVAMERNKMLILSCSPFDYPRFHQPLGDRLVSMLPGRATATTKHGIAMQYTCLTLQTHEVFNQLHQALDSTLCLPEMCMIATQGTIGTHCLKCA